MEKKNEVEVVIGGEMYKLMAVESEEYIQKLASYINKKIAEIYKSKSSPTVTGYLRTLYISINIADEFFKEQEKYEVLGLEHTKLLEEMKKFKLDNDIYIEELGKLRKTVDKTENKVETEEIEKIKLENRQQAELLEKLKAENKEQVELLDRMKAENNAYFSEMSMIQSENYLLKQRAKTLKNQLDLSKAELKEYIDTFS